MAKYAEPDEYTGVTLESGRFFILFEHPTGRGRVKKRIQLRASDVTSLRRAIDAYAALVADEVAEPSAGFGGGEQ